MAKKRRRSGKRRRKSKSNDGCITILFVWPFQLFGLMVKFGMQLWFWLMKMTAIAFGYAVKGFIYLLDAVFSYAGRIRYGTRIRPNKSNDSVYIYDGRDYEYYVAQKLANNGYKNVEVTKESGDFGADILATYHGKRYSIQCKYYNKPVGVSAVQQAVAGKIYYHCDKSMVCTNTYFTHAAVKLANETGTILWYDFV